MLDVVDHPAHRIRSVMSNALRGRRTRRAVATAVAVVGTACADASESARTLLETSPPYRSVQLTEGDAESGVIRVSATAEVSLGATARGEPLADVRSALIMGPTSIVVADAHLGVHLFDTDSDTSIRVASLGSGPGEVRSVSQLIRTDAGFSVWDDALWRRTDFKNTGEHAADSPVAFETLSVASTPPMYPSSVLISRAGPVVSIMLEKSKVPEGEARYRERGEVVLFSPDFGAHEWIAGYGGPDMAWADAPWGRTPVPVPLGQTTLFAVSPVDATTCLGDTGHPEIRCVAGGRTVSFSWSAVAAVASADDPEVDAWATSVRRDYEAKLRPEEVEQLLVDVELPVRRPYFDQLLFDATGLLWVLTTEASGDRSARVVDPTGQLVGTVSTPEGRPLSITDNRMATLVEDALGAPSVRLFRVDRAPR